MLHLFDKDKNYTRINVTATYSKKTELQYYSHSLFTLIKLNNLSILPVLNL